MQDSLLGATHVCICVFMTCANMAHTCIHIHFQQAIACCLCFALRYFLTGWYKWGGNVKQWSSQLYLLTSGKLCLLAGYVVIWPLAVKVVKIPNVLEYIFHLKFKELAVLTFLEISLNDNVLVRLIYSYLNVLWPCRPGRE